MNTMASNDYWKEHGDNDEQGINHKIHGWLTFFLVMTFLRSVLTPISLILTFNMGDYLNNGLLCAADIVATISVSGMGFYAIAAFYRRQPNAVFIARLYIVIFLLMSLLGLLAAAYLTEAFNPIAKIATPVLWSVIWLCFFRYSDQVQCLFPLDTRRVGKYDYLFGAACIFVPIALLLFGINTI